MVSQVRHDSRTGLTIAIGIHGLTHALIGFFIIKQFRNQGYVLRKTIPLYLEPGRGKFEILSVFVPDRAGLLGQKRQKTALNPVKPAHKTLFVQKSPTFRQRKD